MEHGGTRVSGDRLLGQSYGLMGLTKFADDQTKKMMRVRIVGLILQRLPKQAACLCELSRTEVLQSLPQKLLNCLQQNAIRFTTVRKLARFEIMCDISDATLDHR